MGLVIGIPVTAALVIGPLVTAAPAARASAADVFKAGVSCLDPVGSGKVVIHEKGTLTVKIIDPHLPAGTYLRALFCNFDLGTPARLTS